MAHKVGRLAEKQNKISEISAIVVFVILTFVFAAFHSFEQAEITEQTIKEEIKIAKVEITEQVKKTVRPSLVKIPIAVEDEEIIEEDVELEIETADFDISSEPPPPPPPPADDEEEVFDFFAIQEKPQMVPGAAKKIMSYIKKHYPPMAKKSGVSGKVILKFICNKQGLPVDIKVVLEKPTGMGFGEVAVQAIQQARFKPGKQRDMPVSVRMSQKLNFKTQR